MKKAFTVIFVIICLAAGSFAGYKLISTLLEYKAGVDEYKSLLAYTSDKKPEKKEEKKDDGIPECPIDVDWDELKGINQDIVGWLHVGAVNISYPIVQGKDNSYYLHRTFKGQYNFSGSIFLEEQNKNDFSDPNTVLYGHNMRNGSMFGVLKHLLTEEKYEEDPYFWILTPEKNYCYKIFSLKNVPTSSDTYLLFDGMDQKYLDWCSQMHKESEVKLDEPKFDLNSRIGTLSTCTKSQSTKFVVQGIRLN